MTFARVARSIAGFAALAALSATGTAAQDFPTKPITLVVPYAAGGPTDAVARQMADSMSRTLGQQVVIENVTGAGGTAGSERVAKAAPDGYTILLHHTGLGAAPNLYANLRYDTKTAFTPLGLINSGPMVVVSKKGVKAKNLKELTDWMVANVDTINMAHAGVGSNSHVCGLLIQQVLGKQFKFVAYRGTGPAMNDLVGGQIDVMCDQSTNAVPQIVGGTIQAYAILDDNRLDSIKDVPTSAEGGLPKLKMVLYNGMYAPKGAPKVAVDKLNDAIQKAVADKDMVAKFAQVGTKPFPETMRSAAAHEKYFLEDVDRQAAMFKAAGVTPAQPK